MKLQPVPFEEGEEDKTLLWERGGLVDEETFLTVLGQASTALEQADLSYVFMGGIASAIWGRPRWTHDIDVFISRDDAEAALEALSRSGFETQKTFPDWLFKAMKERTLVDLIFKSAGGIYLDDDMVARSTFREFGGMRLRVISPEDLLVIKALAHDEHSARHWYDALGLVVSRELEWDYLIMRARHGPQRVLSLLLYARSNDLPVPSSVIHELFESMVAQ